MVRVKLDERDQCWSILSLLLDNIVEEGPATNYNSFFFFMPDYKNSRLVTGLMRDSTEGERIKVEVAREQGTRGCHLQASNM